MISFLCLGLFWVALFAILAAVTAYDRGLELARMRKGIQDYLDGNYGPRLKRKVDKCPHGHFKYESCESCIDRHFLDVLEQHDATTL